MFWAIFRSVLTGAPLSWPARILAMRSWLTSWYLCVRRGGACCPTSNWAIISSGSPRSSFRHFKLNNASPAFRGSSPSPTTALTKVPLPVPAKYPTSTPLCDQRFKEMQIVLTSPPRPPFPQKKKITSPAGRYTHVQVIETTQAPPRSPKQTWRVNHCRNQLQACFQRQFPVSALRLLFTGMRWNEILVTKRHLAREFLSWDGILPKGRCDELAYEFFGDEYIHIYIYTCI